MVKLKIKAVIFDMDGVITNTMPYHFTAWKKIYEAEGFCLTKEEIYVREGQPGYNTIREISKKHGLFFSEDRVRQILDKKEKLFKKIVRRRFIPGARNFLHFLKKKGFVLALVTGTARHEVVHILPKKLLGLFSVVVTGSEVRRGKPHPEPYLIALKKLRLKPKDVVVLENAPFGIHSAKRARLSCVALETSLPKEYLKDADLVFTSFKDMRRHMRFDAAC